MNRGSRFHYCQDPVECKLGTLRSLQGHLSEYFCVCTPEETSYNKLVCQTVRQSVQVRKAVSPVPSEGTNTDCKQPSPFWGALSLLGYNPGAHGGRGKKELLPKENGGTADSLLGRDSEKKATATSWFLEGSSHSTWGVSELLLILVMTASSATLEIPEILYYHTMKTLECIHWLKLIDPASGCFNYSRLFSS